jgi:cyclic pyranopterin phosphate synthase
MLEKNAVSFIDKGTGALKWIIQSGDHQTSVLYIDSPCFRRDIKTCRNYGEIRVLPDFKLQSCILKEANVQLNLDEGKDYVINQFEGLWNDFNQC